MFSFQKSCEISFQVVGSREKQNCLKDEVIDNDLLTAVNLYMASSEPVRITKPPKHTTSYKRKTRVQESQLVSNGKDDTKKILHRDTERQRRVAMAGLLNTLSSLLPTHIVKGKRSVSDHIEETVSYIKHLKININELQNKRDRLRTLQANSVKTSPPVEEDISYSSIPGSVSIYSSNGGLEIHISGGNKNNEFRFSDALKVLLEQGLSVTCSVSTKVNGVFIHNIQCQVSNNIDVQRLEQRLYNVVSSNSSSSTSGIEYCPLEWMEKEAQLYSLLNFA